MKDIYYLKFNSKKEYEDASGLFKFFGYEWENKDRLNALLSQEKPILWLVGLNLKKRRATLIEHITGCASICQNYHEQILKYDELIFLLETTKLGYLDFYKLVDIAKTRCLYSCDTLSDGSLSLCVQTLDDRDFYMNRKTEYLIDNKNAEKLKKAVSKISNEELEVALLRMFHKFTHLEFWFESDEFERYCSLQNVTFSKKIIKL